MTTYQLEVYKSHFMCVRPSSFAHRQEIFGTSLDDAFDTAQEDIIRGENRSDSTIAVCANLHDPTEDRWYNILHQGEWYNPSEKRERVKISQNCQ